MQIERLQSEQIIANELPDGSRILVDSGKEAMFALNPTAAAAWDACSNPTTLTELAGKMQVTEEVAEEAVLQLEAKKLVAISESRRVSRRGFMTGAAVAAVPLVLGMTMSEQKAYASCANSGFIGTGGDGFPFGNGGNGGFFGDGGNAGNGGWSFGSGGDGGSGGFFGNGGTGGNGGWSFGNGGNGGDGGRP